MIKKETDKIEFYQSEKLMQHLAIGHFFSTRKGDYTEIDLLSKEIGFLSANIVVPKQTHKCNVARITY